MKSHSTIILKKTAALIALCFLFLSLLVPTSKAMASDSIAFILLSRSSAEMKIDESFTLYVLATTSSKVTFKSSKSSVASVNTYGRVTAKKAGSAVITAKINGAEASCRIKVLKTTITLPKKSVTLECDETYALHPVTSTGAEITYSSNK